MTRYAKAVVACLSALATWGVTAGADGSYDQVELWGLLGALAAVLITYITPNDPPAGEPADPHLSERGAVSWVTVAAVAVVICCVVWLIANVDVNV
jgi:hypothetical protein